MQTIDKLTNHFLIAMPALDGSIFERAVTYICKHNQQGAMGLIINQPLMLDIHEVLGELNIKIDNPYIRDLALASGGPIQNQAGFVLHRDGKKWKNTFHPANEISITTSSDILEALAKQTQHVDALMTLGYAGWSAGQLEAEVVENNWLICPADLSIIFEVPLKERWQTALKLLV